MYAHTNEVQLLCSDSYRSVTSDRCESIYWEAKSFIYMYINIIKTKRIIKVNKKYSRINLIKCNKKIYLHCIFHWLFEKKKILSTLLTFFSIQSLIYKSSWQSSVYRVLKIIAVTFLLLLLTILLGEPEREERRSCTSEIGPWPGFSSSSQKVNTNRSWTRVPIKLSL